MRVAIYGAGSLGTVFGAYISKAGEQIDLINRNVKHVEALNNKGATLVGTVNFTQKVTALTPDKMEGKYDIIFLLTKQMDNVNVVTRLKDFLEDDGVICTCQNGLPELLVSSIIGEDRTYGCAIGWGATLLEPGKVEVTSHPDGFEFVFGALTNKGEAKPHFKEVIRLMNLMGKAVTPSNFIGHRWTKLLVNSAFSGLSTVTGATFGVVSKDKRSRKLVQCILKETIETAKAANVKIEPMQGKDIVKIFNYNGPIKKFISYCLIPLAMKKHTNIKASMLQDIEKGKLCEVDFINGVLSEQSKKYNVPTPVNDLTVKLIHEIESGKRIPSFDNLKEYVY